MLIRCPLCEDMAYLTEPEWEDFNGDLPLGEAKRIGLICLKCHQEFLLQVTLGQVITERR